MLSSHEMDHSQTSTLLPVVGDKPAIWVSVVMPVRKCRATIGKSLDTLLRQQVPERCEIIFVGDRTDDDSFEVIRNHPLKTAWDFVEIFHPGRGLAQAYNLGWRHARAGQVLFMHSDCYPADDDALLRMVKCLEREKAPAVKPLVGIPQDDWEHMSFWDRVTSSQYRHAKPDHNLMGKFDLFSRGALERIGGFDEERFFSAAEDADIAERLMAIGKVAPADVLVIHAHQHPASAQFSAVLRKHAQIGESFGALIRKQGPRYAFSWRALPITGINALKLVLTVGIFIPPVSLYAMVLMLLLSIYYARWAMLSRDWRVMLVPFAVPLMFAVYSFYMICGYVRGRQSFDYIKAS